MKKTTNLEKIVCSIIISAALFSCGKKEADFIELKRKTIPPYEYASEEFKKLFPEKMLPFNIIKEASSSDTESFQVFIYRGKIAGKNAARHFHLGLRYHLKEGIENKIKAIKEYELALQNCKNAENLAKFHNDLNVEYVIFAEVTWWRGNFDTALKVSPDNKVIKHNKEMAEYCQSCYINSTAAIINFSFYKKGELQKDTFYYLDKTNRHKKGKFPTATILGDLSRIAYNTAASPKPQIIDDKIHKTIDEIRAGFDLISPADEELGVIWGNMAAAYLDCLDYENAVDCTKNACHLLRKSPLKNYFISNNKKIMKVWRESLNYYAWPDYNTPGAFSSTGEKRYTLEMLEQMCDTGIKTEQQK